MASRNKKGKQSTKTSSTGMTTSTLYALSIMGFLLSAFYLPQYSKGWATGLALLCVIIFISVLVLMEKGE